MGLNGSTRGGGTMTATTSYPLLRARGSSDRLPSGDMDMGLWLSGFAGEE